MSETATTPQTLVFEEPVTTMEFWNILLYGPTGNGKTMGGLSAPGPILFANADGSDASKMGHLVHGSSREIKEVRIDKSNASKFLDLLYLEAASGKYKTFVMDPVGEVYQALLDEWSNSGQIGINLRGDASQKIERFCRAMRDLPINFVLVCQEEIEMDSDKKPMIRPAMGPTTGALKEKVMRMMSIIGYVGVVPAKDDEPRRWVAQLVEFNGRRAKDRSESLGDSRDIDLSEWIETATAAFKPQTKKEKAK